MKLAIFVQNTDGDIKSCVMRILLEMGYIWASSTAITSRKTWLFKSGAQRQDHPRFPSTISIEMHEGDKRNLLLISTPPNAVIHKLLITYLVSGGIFAIAGVHLSFLFGLYWMTLVAIAGFILIYIGIRIYWIHLNTAWDLVQMLRSKIQDQGFQSKCIGRSRISTDQIANWIILFTLGLLVDILFLISVTQMPLIGVVTILSLVAFLTVYALWIFLVELNKNLMYHGAYAISGLATVSFLSLEFATVVPVILVAYKINLTNMPGYDNATGIPYIHAFGGIALFSVLHIFAFTQFFRHIKNTSFFTEEYASLKNRPQSPPASRYLRGVNERSILNIGFGLLATIGIVWCLMGTATCIWIVTGCLNLIAHPDSDTDISALVEFISIAAGQRASPDVPVYILLTMALVPLIIVTGVWAIIIANKAYAWSSNVLGRLFNNPLDQEYANDILDSLCDGINRPFVYVTNKRTGQVSIQSYGILQIKHRLVIDAQTLRGTLTRSEVTALCAHELAHMINKDCIRRTRIQRVARLVCLGDSCVCLFEDSFVTEYEADETAVLKFKIHPAELICALEKIQAVSTLIKHHATGHFVAPARTAIPFSSWPRIIRSIGLWHHLYFHGSEFGFWHPSVSDRCARLKDLHNHMEDDNGAN